MLTIFNCWGDGLLRLPWPVFVGCHAGIMTVTLHLDGAIAEALAIEAARRGQTADYLAADLAAAQLTRAPRRRLAFAAVGAPTSGRGAAEVDEMLAEGFGRDLVLIVNTGPLVATADRADRTQALLEGDEGSLITTAMVIAEAAYLHRRGRLPDRPAAWRQSGS